MAKGFTDDKGKFRPTGNNGSKSSKTKSIEPEGTKVFTENNVEIPESLLNETASVDEVLGFVEEELEAEQKKLGKGTVALNITDPLAETKTARRKQAMTLKLDDEDSIITKQEIEWMRKFLNDSFGTSTVSDEDFIETIKDKVANSPEGFRITPEQTTQGLDFLRKSKNKKFFGDREMDILENFKEFRLIDWFDAGNATTFFVPLWRVESTDGNSFEYYFAGGEVNITG